MTRSGRRAACSFNAAADTLKAFGCNHENRTSLPGSISKSSTSESSVLGLIDFLHEFHVDRVFSEHGELIHRLKIDGDENGHSVSGSIRLPHLMLSTSGIFRSCIRAFIIISSTRAGVTSGFNL